MAWFRMDDEFHSHPKVIAAGNAAVGLWVRCGTWSANYWADGKIPMSMIKTMGKPVEIKALVATRLWVPTDEGMLMPDYLDYNLSKASHDAVLKADAERKRLERAKGAKGVRHGDDGRFEGNGTSHREYDEAD